MPLSAAAVADAQAVRIIRIDQSRPAKPLASAVYLRITRDIVDEPLPRLATGVVADTEVMPNGRLGFSLVTTSGRSFDSNPQNRRQSRGRKPAVTFVLKF
jgi:hypothetical protein